jgi:non-specific serine/threonine protein kinase/serine/threonine-protein kinase
VVRKAVEYLSALDRESHGDARLQSELAAAWQRVGDIQGAPYGANLGDRAGALRSYREALRIWTSLAAHPDKTTDVQTHLALLHRGMGDVLSEDQRHRDALTEYRSSLAILESLSPRPSQQKLILTGRIGTELVMLGRVQEGTEWTRRAVEQANSLLSAGMDESARHDVSELYARAGRALLRAGAIDAALAMHREEIALCENLVSSVASEKNAHYRRDLALAYRNLGDALLRQNEFPAALARYEQAKPIQETLLRVDDANAQMRMELSVTWSKISELLAQTGDIAGAERARANDLRLSERLMKDDPQSPAYRRGYSYSLFQMANLLRKAVRPTDAKRYFLRQAETLRPLENRPDKPTQRQLLNCYRALGELESDPKESAAYLNKALLLAGNLGDDSAAQSIRDVLAHLSN